MYVYVYVYYNGVELCAQPNQKQVKHSARQPECAPGLSSPPFAYYLIRWQAGLMLREVRVVKWAVG